MTDYEAYIAGKSIKANAVGLAKIPELNAALFPYQHDIVGWALRRGRAAIFADCGMGKTLMQLEWARCVVAETGGKVLILTPLAVAHQTAEEAKRFGISATVSRDGVIHDGITITNYQQLHKFDLSQIVGVVLDESSIIKAFDGKMRTLIVDSFANTPYRLACTATPAPNDHVELGNHAEFLGVMTRVEMLASYFCHDGGETSVWRLKGHAETEFWRWVATWAVCIRRPSDLGYPDVGFDMPRLDFHEHVIASTVKADGVLFFDALTLNDQRQARRESMTDRVELVRLLVQSEWDKLAAEVPDVKVEKRVFGSAEVEEKDQAGCAKTANGGKPRRAKGIHGGLQSGQSAEVQENAGAASGSERQTQGAVRGIGENQGSRKRDSEGMAAGKPDQAQGAAFADVQTDVRAVQCNDGCTESCVRDMRVFGCFESTEVSACGSLPFDGECEGAALLGMQLRNRQVQGFSRTVAGSGGVPRTSWVIWCELNAEQDALEDAFGELAFSIFGSLDDKEKQSRMECWLRGDRPILISKVSICGFGINMQHCFNMAFVGLSHSYEQFYQATRRCWRYGQTHDVQVHVVTTDAEMAILRNIKRKQREADTMATQMIGSMADVMNAEIRGIERNRDTYKTDVAKGKDWTMHLGDCVDVVRALPRDSVHFTVFSPPFASLYTYSNSPRDMGNCRTHSEFFAQFKFLVAELHRVTMPGRLLSFHCMNLPTSKERDGHTGITDFRGELIRTFVDAGWIFHSEVCIWKDPVTAMQRTKALGLLHKTIKKDSSMSRQGIPDYLVTMRKPGENPERIAHTAEEFPVELWQRYASPVWAIEDGTDEEGFCILKQDINPSDTLQKESAREEKDERHICPLQLDVIRRALKLWSNPGDLVLSPFGGIGSEGFVALKEGRRFVGAELKQSYWKQACANLAIAEKGDGQLSLLDL